MDGLRHFPAGKVSAFISQRSLRVALNVFRFIADDRYGADQDAWVTKEDVRSHLCSESEIVRCQGSDGCDRHQQYLAWHRD